MDEQALEKAICLAFQCLLPDLHGEGYRIVSQQAVLLERRLDLLLRKPDGQICIIELKQGAPPMPQVRDQILDYASCWELSFPTQQRPRLIVIGNSIPETTKLELANFGIESRAITKAAVIEALDRGSSGVSVSQGLKLVPDDPDRVKHLLSDYGSVTLPANLPLCPPWTHEKAFLALVNRREKHKELWRKNIYVQLYPQAPNCAVLYGPKAQSTRRGPLHLNPRVKSWNEAAFQKIKPPLIKYVQSDNKGPGKERLNFDWYQVTDWDGFAAALGL